MPHLVCGEIITGIITAGSLPQRSRGVVPVVADPRGAGTRARAFAKPSGGDPKTGSLPPHPGESLTVPGLRIWPSAADWTPIRHSRRPSRTFNGSSTSPRHGRKSGSSVLPRAFRSPVLTPRGGGSTRSRRWPSSCSRRLFALGRAGGSREHAQRAARSFSRSTNAVSCTATPGIAIATCSARTAPEQQQPRRQAA